MEAHVQWVSSRQPFGFCKCLQAAATPWCCLFPMSTPFPKERVSTKEVSGKANREPCKEVMQLQSLDLPFHVGNWSDRKLMTHFAPKKYPASFAVLRIRVGLNPPSLPLESIQNMWEGSLRSQQVTSWLKTAWPCSAFSNPVWGPRISSCTSPSSQHLVLWRAEISAI